MKLKPFSQLQKRVNSIALFFCIFSILVACTGGGQEKSALLSFTWLEKLSPAWAAICPARSSRCKPGNPLRGRACRHRESKGRPKERFRQYFKQHDAILWSYLKQVNCHPMLLPEVCRLILDGVLTIDLNQPISESSAIGWNHTTNQ